MTTYSVRKLKQGPAAPMPKRRWAYGLNVGVLLGTALRLAVDNAERTFDIDTTEVSLSGDEIIKGLRSGQLSSQDLVFERDQWVSLADHDEFFDVARKRARIERVKRLIPSMLIIAPCLALVALKLLKPHSF
jgi:hypothetical protein